MEKSKIMKNREIYNKVLKDYKKIAKEFLENSGEYYKIHIIYEIIDEIDNQGLDITDEEEEKICDYVYNVCIEYDGSTNINIYNIVYTINEFITYDKMSVKDILKMDIKDFCNQIII